MIPKIEKIHLTDKNLSKAAKLEVKLIRQQPNTINGFRFRTRDDRCVAIGVDTGNDFDVWNAAAEIQCYVKKMTGVHIEKFRFAFI